MRIIMISEHRYDLEMVFFLDFEDSKQRIEMFYVNKMGKTRISITHETIKRFRNNWPEPNRIQCWYTKVEIETKHTSEML